MVHEIPGKVYFVGAGPGAPDLITLRGAKILREADVILYDRLVHPDLLHFASPEAKRIYVGKKSGENPAFRQSVIHQLMVKHARRGKIVVRLKGGDPFVFGRGGEETLFLQEAGINFEVVPGVTAATAAPESAGIPVTHRTLSSSFAVFAGRESDTKQTVGIDWEVAARIPTAVFLMGAEKLPEIVAELVKHGRSRMTPVAVITNASLPDQKVITGTLENIVEQAAHLVPPATIVVGEVVQLREQIGNLTDTRPLMQEKLCENVIRLPLQATKAGG